MRPALIGFLLGFSLLAGPVLAQVPAPLAEEAGIKALRDRRDAVLAREADALSALAVRLRREGKTAEAEAAHGPDLRQAPDGSTRFVPLPRIVPKVDRPASTEASRVRTETATALVALAADAAKSRPPAYALADACLRTALDRDPDQPEARRLLGFVPHNGGWATPFAREMKSNHWVEDATFGWVPEDWLPHLGRGELPAPGVTGRWLPTAEADALRQSWPNRWQITTEHFRIGTNVPLAEAISFGRKLEILHELFFALTADLVAPDRLPLALRYTHREVKPVPAEKRHQVSYFATRDEFARHVAPILGENGQKSLGLYVPRRDSKTLGAASYFFAEVNGQLPIEATLFHEGSHQILFESGGPDRYEQNVGNYWVFEGLGTYFETLTPEPDGSVRIGGLVGPRIAEARKRLFDRHEFVPIKNLVALDKRGYNTDPEIYLHYAESMALTVFLMQADDGRYRDGFLDYVQDAYKGRLRQGAGRSLEARVGTRYVDLDREFLNYLKPKP